MVAITRHCTVVRAPPLVLSGHPGVGKSALARQFALEHWDEYTAVLMVHFTPCGLPIELARYGLVELKLPIQRLPHDDRCKATLQALTKMRCLLIYDNIADPDQFADWLPKVGAGCRVLVTATGPTGGAPARAS